METLIKPARALLLGLVASMAALAIACSGSAETSSADVKTPATTATAAATTASAPVASTTTAAAPTSTGDPEKDLIAKGKVIFQQTAGGTGCQLCHGMQGRGDGAANLGAPNIQGADISRIRVALSGGVPVMGYLNLSEEEIVAVAAFVASLGGQ